MALVSTWVSIFERKDLEYMVYQLKYDSVHKTFGGHDVDLPVFVTPKEAMVNGGI